MQAILYKSDFSSTIGRIFYLWGDYRQENKLMDLKEARRVKNIESDNPELKPENHISVFFLANNKKAFDLFVGRLNSKEEIFEIIYLRSELLEQEIIGYLEKEIKTFSIKPVFLSGSTLEHNVWKAAMRVGYGKVASYKELAEYAGYPNAWRAVGTAISHNPVMLVVPCHRIIKSDGRIGRYGGGEKVKEFLLDLEQN